MAINMSALNSIGTANQQNSVLAAVQTKMIRDDMANQAQAMQGVLQSMPQANMNPSYLGTNIDIKA